MNVLLKSCELFRGYAVHALACAAMIAGANIAGAAIMATENFDAGFPGAADAVPGWYNAWTPLAPSGSVTLDINVPGTGSPVATGGNYLDVAVDLTPGYAGAGTNSIRRKFNDGPVSGLDPYRISFTYRIDEDIDSASSTFTGFEDRYMIAEGGSGMTTLNHTSPSNANNGFSWSIWGFGGDLAQPSGTVPQLQAGVAKNWAFYNGDSTNTVFDANSSAMINTGIAMTTGGVYEFTVVVDPVAKTWDGTVSDGTNSFTSTGMGFRNTEFKKYLYFLTKRSRVAAADDDIRQYSVDSISITNVPEPSSMLLAMLGSIVALGRNRRGKQA